MTANDGATHLAAGEVSRAIVAAIRAEHAPLSVDVRDRGAYVRVLVPRRCRVSRAAIERELGRPFRLPSDLELVMPSFKGAFRVSEEEATWELSQR